MSGLLSGVLAVVGIAAAVASGGTLGLVAGAMLAVGAAASAGLIGGSVGKFMNSGIGHGLMAAVALGSVANAVYGANAADAGAQEAAQTTQQAGAAAPIGAAGANVIPTATADAQAAAMTHTSILEAAGMGQEVSSIQASDPALAQVSGVSPQTLTAMNSQTIGAGPVGAEGSQAAATATAADTNAVQPTAAETQSTNNGAVAGYHATAADQPGEESPAGTTAPPPGAGAPEGGAGEGYEEPDSAAPSSGVGGFLSKAMDSKGGAALIQGAGSMIGGIGAGIAQKQAVEDQLKAQEWGNAQWQQPGQVAALQSAAAKPITVPQGYLQRAAMVKTMLSGSNGVQPLPAASPGAPLAPSPVPTH